MILDANPILTTRVLPGDVGALPAELKRSSALSAVDPDNQAASLTSAARSAGSAGGSASDRSADDVVSSSGLLADRGAEDAQAAGSSIGAGSADSVTGLGSGRGADERQSSDAMMARRSDEQLDSVTDAGAADLDSADMAARGDGVKAAARTGSQREQLPKEPFAEQEVERAARQSVDRAADVEAARGQGLGAARDASRSAEAGSSVGEGVIATSRQGNTLPDADLGAGSIGAGDGMQRQRGSDKESDRRVGAGTDAMQARSVGAGQGVESSTVQA